MPARLCFSVLLRKSFRIKVAEGVRFELTRPFGLPVFKTGAINLSATPPAVAHGVDAGRGQRPRLQRAIAPVFSKRSGDHTFFQSEQSQPRSFSSRSISFL
jgi:hypothetical protein